MQLLSTPLSVSVLEGAEKQLLGSASISLEPLMQAAGMAEQWVPLLSDGAPVGEVCVSVVAPSPLMSEEDWEESMVLTLSVQSLHKLPATWGVAECSSEEEHIFAYSAQCSFMGESFEFAEGKLVLPPPPAEEAEDGAAAAPAAEGEEGAASPAAAPAEAEAPVSAVDAEEAAEAASGSISWAAEPVVRFLGPEMTSALRKQLQAGESPLSLSIARKVKNAETHFDSNAAKYAATCTPVPAGLLVADSTHCAARTVLIPAPRPEEPIEPPEVGKGKGPEILPEEEEEEEHPYVSAATYLKIVLDTTRPLEPKPLPPPPPLPKVSELIPKRVLPQFAPKTAVEEFDAQVASIVDSMVGEWANLFPGLELSGDGAGDESAKDDRRRKLLYALNTSGKYWMFKERLKRSVVRLVKDTMSRPTSEPLDSRASDLFYNDLYVQLTQRLHKALNGIFFPPTEAPAAPSMPDQPEGVPMHIVLGALATEMEMVFAFEQANYYHKERITSSKHMASVWYDYALFLMRTNDLAMAEECSREAIALSPTTPEYLLAHGAILTSRGNMEEAEVFLKASLEASPNSTNAWLVVSLLYGLMGRTQDQRTATKQARQLHGEDLTGAYLALAYALIPINAVALVESALQMEEKTCNGVTGAVLLCRGELQLSAGQDPAVAAETIEAGLEVVRKSAAGYVLLGQARLRLGQAAEAQAAFGKALELSPQPYPLPALLLSGQLCLDGADFVRAKELFLYACRQSPSCTSWLGAGQACHGLGDLEQAEEALAEANVLNNRHPIVWGQLALLCLQKQRSEEASQSLEQAYKLGLAHAGLLCQLGEALFKAGQWQDAEAALRRSLLAQETAAARQLLADTFQQQQRLEEAVSAFKAAIALPDASNAIIAHCKEVAAHILRVLLNRPEEADAL